MFADSEVHHPNNQQSLHPWLGSAQAGDDGMVALQLIQPA